MTPQLDGTVPAAIEYLKARRRWRGSPACTWIPRPAAATNVARTFIEVAEETADSDKPLIISPGLRRLAKATTHKR